MREVCPSLFTPFQNISVDERMVKSKARFLKQYIHHKPTKWGFKLWVIADSLSAYTLDMVVYTGSGKRGNVLRDDFAPEGLRENGGEDWVALGFSAQRMEQVGASVVIKVCQAYFNLNHVLYTDNFYTSVPLYQSLLENGMYACGTAKKNSTGFPKSLKNDGVWEKGKARGAVRSTRVGDVLCLQWKDKRVITMFSTKHSRDHRGWVQRKTKVNSQFQRLIVCRPQVVANCNNYMGGGGGVLIIQTRCFICNQYSQGQKSGGKHYSSIFLTLL